MRNKFIFILVAAVFVCVLADSAFAQVSTRAGAIFGRVQDDKGAPLPGVNTTLECTSIGAPQSATTGPTGGFRFANIPPGVCSVTFALEGFTEIRQEEVRVSIGGEVQLSITMRPTLEEEFVVVADTPVVDTRKLGNETTFTSEYLEQVPSGRDPWTMIEQTPGVDNDRINIAGSESGQQTNFFARGDGFASNTWRYDGVTAEDNAALGASTYYDFDSFEEVQITSGGADASIGKSGVVVNIVTKRGGNKWEANVSGYYTGEDLQSDNTPDEILENPTTNPVTGLPITRSNRIDQVYEYGFDIGGPIVTDRLFVWGSYRKNQVDLFTRVGLFDKTELISWNFKTNVNINQSNELQFSIWTNDKNKQGRTFDPGNQAEETTWNQGSPGTIFDKYPTIQHTWIPNDHTILTSRYGYFAISFGLEPSGGNQVPMIYLLDSGRWEETGYFVTPIDRPTHSFNADLNWFKENWWGGDHEWKFGFEYSHNKLGTFSSYGNGYLIYDIGLQPGGGPLTSGFVKAQYFVDGHTKYDNFSVYATDTIRKDRLTLNLGVRLDTADGENEASTLPAVPNFESILPALSYQGGPGTDRFTYVSPRLGATYDLTGDGKTILRGNYALYYSGYGPGYDTYSNPTFTYIGASSILYTNLNGDRRLQPNELDFSALSFYGGLKPGGFVEEEFEATLAYDEDLHETPIHEIIVGFERELFKDFSFAANFTHRTYDGTIAAVAREADGSLVDPEDFIPQTPLQVNTSVGNFTVPYSVLGVPSNGDSLLTNIDEYSQSYNGIDLIGRKRMSNNFMINASVTLQQQKAHYDGGNSYFVTTGEGFTGIVFADPLGVPNYDDQLYAFVSAGSGKAGIYPFSEWTMRVSGVYQLPWDMTVGAFMRYQQGQPRPLFTSVSDNALAGGGLNSFYGTSTHLILVAPLDTLRYENIFTLDFNLRKTFEIGAYGRITGSVDVFNVTNSNMVILRQNNVRSSTFNIINENLSPRAVRFGLRYSF